MIKDEIFNYDDKERKEVVVWGKQLYVSSMSGTERSKFKKMSDKLINDGKEADADTLLVIFSLEYEDGAKVFELEDFVNVSKKKASTLTMIAREALKVNGLLAESVEDAKKN